MSIEVKDINGFEHSFEKEDMIGVEFDEGADVVLLKDGRRIGFTKHTNMFHVDGICEFKYLDRYILNIINDKNRAIKRYKNISMYAHFITGFNVGYLITSLYELFAK